MRGSTNTTGRPIASVDSGNSNPKKSTRGCARVARQKTKGGKRNEGLGFCWFRSPHAVVEKKTGELALRKIFLVSIFFGGRVGLGLVLFWRAFPFLGASISIPPA